MEVLYNYENGKCNIKQIINQFIFYNLTRFYVNPQYGQKCCSIDIDFIISADYTCANIHPNRAMTVTVLI